MTYLKNESKKYCDINCTDDKPYIEIFFSRYKCDEVYCNDYCAFSDILLGWMQYKYWHKTERIYRGLGFRSIPYFKKIERHTFSKGISV